MPKATNETIFFNTIHNLILLGNSMGLDLNQIKNQINREIDSKQKTKKLKKKTQKKKAVRPPLWISDSSDDNISR